MRQDSGGRDPRRWLALALLGTAFFMVILDGTIVYVALPSIDAALGFSAGDLQWVMSAYLLTFGGLLLLGGRSADLLGRRRMFMVGVALFASASLLCGLAWSDQVLVAARVLQGIAAAILAPTALSLLTTVFEEGPERNKALGIWGGIGGVGATSGLLIGGPVTEGLGWEWVFFINVPVGLGVLALCPALLPESRAPVRRRVYDVAGAVTITAALVLLVYAVSEAPQVGWTEPQTIGSIAAAIALAAAFVRIEARSVAPLVPLRIFRSRTLVGGNLVLLTAGAALDGMLIIVTLYAQDVLGYSTVQFGLGVAVLTVMSVVGAVSGQALVTRAGVRPVALTGMILVGGGLPGADPGLGRRQLLRRHLPRLAALWRRAWGDVRRRPDRGAVGRRRAGVWARGGARRLLVQHRQRARDRGAFDRRRRAHGGPARKPRGVDRRRADGGLSGGVPGCARDRGARGDCSRCCCCDDTARPRLSRLKPPARRCALPTGTCERGAGA